MSAKKSRKSFNAKIGNVKVELGLNETIGHLMGLLPLSLCVGVFLFGVSVDVLPILVGCHIVSTELSLPWTNRRKTRSHRTTFNLG